MVDELNDCEFTIVENGDDGYDGINCFHSITS
jgi:hypothetical protein